MHEVNLPGYQPTTKPNFLQIQKAAKAISTCKKTTYPSGSRYCSCTSDGRIKRICRKTSNSCNEYISWSWKYSREHELFLGMAGMHGTYAANMAITNVIYSLILVHDLMTV